MKILATHSRSDGEWPAWPTAATTVILSVAFLIGIADRYIVPDADRTLVMLSAATTFAALLPLAWLIGSGSIRPLAATFWMFGVTAMGIASLAQALLADFPALVDRKLYSTALLLVLLGFLAWYIGYFVLPQKSVSSSSRPALIHRQRLNLLGVAGLVGSAIYAASVGPADFFASRRDLAEGLSSYRTEGQAAAGILQAVGQVPSLVAFICLSVILLRDRKSASRGTVALWTVLLGANVVVNNPISNPRFWFITALLGLLFSLPKLSSRGFRIGLIAGSLAAVLVFPYSDYFRVQADERAPIQINNALQTLAEKDYDQTIMTANAFWWVASREGGYTDGRQLLGAALFAVPRPVWPGKPIDTGVEIGRAMLSAANVNLSSPLWAEFYVDFGWIGVGVGFVLLGWSSRRGDNLFRYVRNLRRPPNAIYLAQVSIPLIAGYTFIILRGPLLQAMSRLTVMLLVLWFIRTRSTSTTGHSAKEPGVKGIDYRTVGP